MNGHFSGLGVVTLDDGTNVQGEFQNSQLVCPFPWANMRVSAPNEADKSEIDLPFRHDDAKGPDHTLGNDCTKDVGAAADIKVESDAENRAEIIQDAENAGDWSQDTQGKMDGRQMRFQYLKSKLDW